MIKLHHKTLTTTVIMMAVISLSACSSGIGKLSGVLSGDGGVNYRNNQTVKKLAIPPDLTKPEFDKDFELPTGIISAVSLKNGTAGPVGDTGNTGNTGNTAKSGGNVASTSSTRRGDLSTIRTISGKTVLQVNDSYPRSLVLTDIMLARIGFSTIRKSSRGDVITARYNGKDVTIDGKRKGFFSKAKGLVGLSGGNSNKALTRGKTYRVTVNNEQGKPIVRISPVAGILSDAAHAKIITLLNSSFNK